MCLLSGLSWRWGSWHPVGGGIVASSTPPRDAASLVSAGPGLRNRVLTRFSPTGAPVLIPWKGEAIPVCPSSSRKYHLPFLHWTPSPCLLHQGSRFLSLKPGLPPLFPVLKVTFVGLYKHPTRHLTHPLPSPVLPGFPHHHNSC